jgi:hypothetical protein
MSTEPQSRSRPLRARLVGFCADDAEPIQRVTRTPNGVVTGGSRTAHEQLREVALRLELELDRLGVGLGELSPSELAEVAWRIDSPEIFRFAVHLDKGLEKRNIDFHASTPELLMEISMEMVSD